MVDESDTDKQVAVPAVRARHKKNKKMLLVAFLTLVIAVAAGGLAAWRLFIWQPAIINPFSAKVMASVQFPLYYPTQLPAGYRISSKSVTEPQSGVVVFDAVGPNNTKIYISEESRPSSFDFGGYYKAFTDLHQLSGSYGSIATGRINSGKVAVGSLTNNKVWILSNTTAQIPPSQIARMLSTMALSY